MNKITTICFALMLLSLTSCDKDRGADEPVYAVNPSLIAGTWALDENFCVDKGSPIIYDNGTAIWKFNLDKSCSLKCDASIYQNCSRYTFDAEKMILTLYCGDKAIVFAVQCLYDSTLRIHSLDNFPVHLLNEDMELNPGQALQYLTFSRI